MVEIIPAINEKNWEDVKKKIELISLHTDWVQLDISDGKFTKEKTWNNPDDLKTLQLKHPVRFEVHLMVLDPEKVIEEWIKAGSRRIIIHYEALKPAGFGRFFAFNNIEDKIKKMSERCRESWVEFGLAIEWQTPLSAIARYLNLVDVVQVLAVKPGPSGQEFNKEALNVVDQLRALQGKFKIELDGGVSLANIGEIKRAGADIIAVASAIFASQEPDKALEALKRELLG